MSMQGEIAFGKWLVKEGHAPKAMVEKCLTAIQKSEKEGLASPTLLKMMYQQGVLSKEEIQVIQKAWGERKTQASSASSSVNPASVHAVAVASDKAESASIAAPTIEPGAAVTTNKHGKVLSSQQAPSTVVATPAPVSATPAAMSATPAPVSAAPAATKCTCPECHSPNSTENKNCSTCGAPLLSNSFAQCTYCHLVQAKGEKHCGACGCDMKTGKVGPKSRICKSCKVTLKQGEIICLACGAPYEQRDKYRRKSVGMVLMAIQLLALGATVVFLSKKNHSDLLMPTSQSDMKLVVKMGDPYGDLNPRTLLSGQKMSEENKRWMASLADKVAQKKWQALQQELEDKEDQLGVHGSLMLGLCFFQMDRGEELLALQKALPEQKDLKALAAAWRLKKAQADLKEFDGLKAYKTLLPVLQSGEATAEQYFFGGLMSMAVLNHSEAKNWFEKGMAQAQPVIQSRLFLYLLMKKDDPQGAEAQLRKLLEESQDKKSMEKLLRPYKGGS